MNILLECSNNWPSAFMVVGSLWAFAWAMK